MKRFPTSREEWIAGFPWADASFRALKPDELVMAGDEYLAMSGEWRDVGGEMPGHAAGTMVKFRREVDA